MTVGYMHAIAERYQSLGYAPYRWFKAEDPPAWQPLAKPLSGARIGMLGVLHTWTRNLAYHPHIHYLVTGGGSAADGKGLTRASVDALELVENAASRSTVICIDAEDTARRHL